MSIVNTPDVAVAVTVSPSVCNVTNVPISVAATVAIDLVLKCVVGNTGITARLPFASAVPDCAIYCGLAVAPHFVSVPLVNTRASPIAYSSAAVTGKWCRMG